MALNQSVSFVASRVWEILSNFAAKVRQVIDKANR